MDSDKMSNNYSKDITTTKLWSSADWILNPKTRSWATSSVVWIVFKEKEKNNKNKNNE